MISLIRKDLLLARPWEYIILASLIVLAQLVNLAPDVFAIVLFVTLTITFFFYDYYYKMNRYFSSLPIKRSTIVMSRYISSFIMVCAIFTMQYIIITFANLFKMELYVYTISDLFLLFCLASIVISVTIPTYYFFKSFYTASLITFFGFVIAAWCFMYLSAETTIDELGDTIFTVTFTELSLVDTIKSIIPSTIYGIIGLTTLGLLIVSYLFTVYINRKKNLV